MLWTTSKCNRSSRFSHSTTSLQRRNQTITSLLTLIALWGKVIAIPSTTWFIPRRLITQVSPLATASFNQAPNRTEMNTVLANQNLVLKRFLKPMLPYHFRMTRRSKWTLIETLSCSIMGSKASKPPTLKIYPRRKLKQLNRRNNHLVLPLRISLNMQHLWRVTTVPSKISYLNSRLRSTVNTITTKKTTRNKRRMRSLSLSLTKEKRNFSQWIHLRNNTNIIHQLTPLKAWWTKIISHHS